MIEAELKKQLDERLINAPRSLEESIAYSVLNLGKRVRPQLSLAVGELLELPQKQALTIGLAVELVHCFTLIHDDLPCMDNDDFRRGKPSNHKVFGEAVALLAGTALLDLAHEIFLELVAHVPPQNFQAAAKRFHSKTGALFEAALLLPMDLAGISESSPEGKALYALSDAVGLAFQTADDLEDAFQDAEKITPTSILHYRTPQEALELTENQLLGSFQSIQNLWPETCSALEAWIQKIHQKLIRALPQK
jgi:geranylgeranyl diphosphate synthase, type II